MIIRNRMPPWHENFKLMNGRSLLLRPIRPEDASPLKGALELMGPIELRERFNTLHFQSNPIESLPLTHPNPKNEIVLVAAESMAPGEALIAAVAYAAITTGTRDAQFTILVSHFVEGQGLSRQFLRKLVKWARGKSLEHLSGELPASHQPLIELAHSLGFTTHPSEQADSLVSARLELRTQSPSPPPPPSPSP